jgi:hypothetical protein
MIKILQRIERAEALTSKNGPSRDLHDCICFPENERPFFLYEEVEAVAARVKCPVHGERFSPVRHLYISDWRREVEVGFGSPCRTSSIGEHGMPLSAPGRGQLRRSKSRAESGCSRRARPANGWTGGLLEQLLGGKGFMR